MRAGLRRRAVLVQGHDRDRREQADPIVAERGSAGPLSPRQRRERRPEPVREAEQRRAAAVALEGEVPYAPQLVDLHDEGARDAVELALLQDRPVAEERAHDARAAEGVRRRARGRCRFRCPRAAPAVSAASKKTSSGTGRRSSRRMCSPTPFSHSCFCDPNARERSWSSDDVEPTPSPASGSAGFPYAHNSSGVRQRSAPSRYSTRYPGRRPPGCAPSSGGCRRGARRRAR